MYLSTTDLLAVMIALVTSVTLVVTSAIANARLTRSRDNWRRDYYDLLDSIKNHCNCAECD
jgi:hypothetical protein